MKLGVIVGHTKSAQGAVTYNGITEYVWNGKVADYMVEAAKKYKDFEVYVDTRDSGGVTGAASRLKAKGCTDCIELHFNAFTKAAYGCEALVIAGDVSSAIHADLLTDKLNKVYGFKERNVTRILPPDYDGDGVLEIKSGGRGYGNLIAAKNAGFKTAILIEPAFMSHKTSESEKIINDQDGYAQLIVQHYAEFGSLKLHPSTTNSTNNGKLDDLVGSLSRHVFSTDLHIIKEYLLAQFILETGRGTSQLFIKHFNAGGMKWRSDAKVENSFSIQYAAHDGVDSYAGFTDFESFLNYYEKFITTRGVYSGWQSAINLGGSKFIEHIWTCGYATDVNYVNKVLALVPEARQLLGYKEEVKEVVVENPSSSFSIGQAIAKILEALILYFTKK